MVSSYDCCVSASGELTGCAKRKTSVFTEQIVSRILRQFFSPDINLIKRVILSSGIVSLRKFFRFPQIEGSGAVGPAGSAAAGGQIWYSP